MNSSDPSVPPILQSTITQAARSLVTDPARAAAATEEDSRLAWATLRLARQMRRARLLMTTNEAPKDAA
jgi:hypothetical protein